MSFSQRISSAGNLAACAVALAVGGLFWVPSLAAARGWFPAPLDDVYIHFDFARALGQGHPFEWIAGQGYSSGETSPLYAVVLSLGWAAGFRGRALGLWAAIVAVLSVASLLGSIRRLVRPAKPWLAWLVAMLPLAIGILDWALFSGMEIALYCAALGRTLVSLDETRATRTGGPTRERRQWHLGLWGAALVLLRPESIVLVAVFAIAAARGAGARPGFVAAARASAPGTIATLGVFALNFAATGDIRSAGAQLKLLSSNPYLSDVDRARVFAENLVTFWIKGVRTELAFTPALVFVVPALAILGAVAPTRRHVGASCVLGALGWIALVSWNGNAPYHNFRYYAPALVLIAIAAAIGVAAIARARRGVVPAGVVAVFAIAILAPRILEQSTHFRGATANIRDQHLELGERVARLPDDARVLLGDAGAIPYASGRTAIDALGLGGYRRMPFAHAAVYGEPATIELIERLAPGDRPTHLALYPNWFATITGRFGVEIDRVTIDKNIVCGGTAKVLYRADWTALDVPHERPPHVLDELDVGDVVDEEAHGYAPPIPHGGWTSLEILADENGARRFDGGRTIPDGATESFIVAASSSEPAVLRVRIDDAAKEILLVTSEGRRELVLDPPRPGAWRTASASVTHVARGERVTLTARGGAYRNFHVWLEREAIGHSRGEQR